MLTYSLLKCVFPVLRNHLRLGLNLHHSRRCYNHEKLMKTPEIQKFFKHLECLSGKDVAPSSQQLSSIFPLLEKRRQVENDLKSLDNFQSEGDKDLKSLVDEEREMYLRKIESIDDAIITHLMSKPTEERPVVLEVIPGVGGREAELFATELFETYIKYCQYKKWECIADNVEWDKNKKASALITGINAFSYLKLEAGTHKVQRVPVTEKLGRVHTSTVSVAVLPQATETEIVLKESDLIYVRKTSGGPGGQNVNKLETCVRITHIPTGITVEDQSQRYQFKNKELALQKLRTILFEIQQKSVEQATNELKKQQIKQSMRSDKIRTYNYQQDRVTDHRIGVTVHNLAGVLKGEAALDKLIKEVVENDKREHFLKQISSILGDK